MKSLLVKILALSAVALVAGCDHQSGTSGALPAPTNLRATAGDGQVTLSWNAVGAATSYTVYYSATSGAGTSGTRLPGITDTSVSVTGLANATTYYFVVSASDSNGESAVSSEASATPVAAQ